MLVWQYWLAMALALAAALALTAACRVETGAPLEPALTVPPPATATPAATPMPGPEPALASRTDILINPALRPESCASDGYCGSFELGGVLTAATWLDADRMYLADYDGKIRLLNVATGASEVVRSGLTIPRGLTVLDGRLYVSDLGNLCAVIEELPGTDAEIRWCRLFGTDRARYLEVIKRVSARIMSYRIDQDGGLSQPHTVLDRLVTTLVDHGPNGLVNDGEWVYASIGDPGDYFRYYRELAPELAAIGVRIELLGTIVRFRPGAADTDTDTDTDVEIWATGLRNTYGISIAADGTIYGADNDEGGDYAHREELNVIVRGGYYGYPEWGTHLAPPEANVTEPVAVLPGKASTFAHANADGVYVAYLAQDGTDDGFVVDRFDYDTWQRERVFKGLNHTTAILERNGLLYLATFDGSVHIINPKTAPVDIKRSRFYADEYVAKGIAAAGPPVVSPGYTVYLHDGRLIYTKEPCAPADQENYFFLHIMPENLDDIPRWRRRYGFDNLDFSFADYGWQSGSGCYVVRELPLYDISVITTGQFIPDGPRTWEVEIPLAR